MREIIQPTAQRAAQYKASVRRHACLPEWAVLPPACRRHTLPGRGAVCGEASAPPQALTCALLPPGFYPPQVPGCTPEGSQAPAGRRLLRALRP
jgi:hypothetical protein